MNPYLRFEPHNSVRKIIDALTAPIVRQDKTVESVCESIESKSEQLPADQQIDNLLDKIANIAHDHYLHVHLQYTAECRSCGRSYKVDIDKVQDFDQSTNFCGRNQYCLP